MLIPEPINKWEQAWYCSECGYVNQECEDGSAWLEWNYCPNCGADMRGCLSKNSQQKLCLKQDLNKEWQTGEWIEHPEIETSAPEYLMFYECSECGDKQCFCKSDIHRKRFCNHCGAKMVEPRESEVSE